MRDSFTKTRPQSKWLICTLLLCAMVIVGRASAESLPMVIEKSAEAQWQVEYTSASPITAIHFRRNPDLSRMTRWRLPADDFVWREVAGEETIQRIDGKAFLAVTVTLTPTYTHLPKDYAPFSPLSDGSMVLYSGRFFACAGPCKDEDNRFAIIIKALEDDVIVTREAVSTEHSELVEANSGSAIYIGSRAPQRHAAYLHIIDPALPESLVTQLNQQMPWLIDYFGDRLVPVEGLPMLLLSYGPGEEGRYGRQGGVLGQQIVMHWYGERSLSDLDANSSSWFFAHEAAHWFQGKGMDTGDMTEAWIHEGGAEYFAGEALLSLQPNSEFVTKRRTKTAKACVNGLEGQQGFAAAVSANAQLLYWCGEQVFLAIEQDLAARQSEHNLYSLWRAYESAVDAGASASSATFYQVLSPALSAQFAKELEHFVSNPQLLHQQWFNRD